MADQAFPDKLGQEAAFRSYPGLPPGYASANAAEAQQANRNPKAPRMPKPAPEEAADYPGF